MRHHIGKAVFAVSVVVTVAALVACESGNSEPGVASDASLSDTQESSPANTSSLVPVDTESGDSECAVFGQDLTPDLYLADLQKYYATLTKYLSDQGLKRPQAQPENVPQAEISPEERAVITAMPDGAADAWITWACTSLLPSLDAQMGSVYRREYGGAFDAAVENGFHALNQQSAAQSIQNGIAICLNAAYSKRIGSKVSDDPVDVRTIEMICPQYR